MAEALVSCLLGLNLVSHYGHLRRSRALRGSPTSCGVWGRLLELYERSNLSSSEEKRTCNYWNHFCMYRCYRDRGDVCSQRRAGTGMIGVMSDPIRPENGLMCPVNRIKDEQPCFAPFNIDKEMDVNRRSNNFTWRGAVPASIGLSGFTLGQRAMRINNQVWVNLLPRG